jgi:glycosyltransferase involved in cell wall biosynthesis
MPGPEWARFLLSGNCLRKVPLLWLIDSLAVGGAEALILPFAQQLVHTRFSLTVCALQTIEGSEIEGQLREQGIEVLHAGARKLRDRPAFERLVALVSERKIALIHAHLTYASTWAALLTRRTGVPSVCSLHVAPFATRQQTNTVRHRIATDVRDWIMRFALNRWATMVVTVSAAIQDEYVRRGLKRAKTRVVHNGIDVTKFNRARDECRTLLRELFGISEHVPLVATVSVLRPAKGIEVLLEAIPRVPDAHFLIVGDGPKREEWQAIAERLGISNRVHWAGYRRDVASFLAGCDVFAHPSLDDAFPTVLLESLAAGVPIVASRVGGIPEIVEEGRIGRLVPAGDSEALANAIREVLTDRDRAEVMRSAARATAARQFSTEAWVDRLSRIYDEVLPA